MHQYYVQVVATMYVDSNGVSCVDHIDPQPSLHLQTSSLTHQFSVSRQHKLIRAGVGDGLPGVFVQYDFSPLLVKFTQVYMYVCACPYHMLNPQDAHTTARLTMCDYRRRVHRGGHRRRVYLQLKSYLST